MPYSADIYFLVCCPKSRQSWVQELLTFPVPQNHLSQCLLCSKHALTWSNLWPLCQESAPGYRIGKQLLEPLHSTGIGISGMLWEIPGAVVWRERGAGCELWEKQEHLFFPPLAKELPFTFSLYFCDGLNSLDEKWVSCYEGGEIWKILFLVLCPAWTRLGPAHHQGSWSYSIPSSLPRNETGSDKEK